MKNIVKVIIITFSFSFVSLHANGMEVESRLGEPSVPPIVQTPKVSLIHIAAFNFYQNFIKPVIEPMMQAKKLWDQPTNVQIIAQIRKNLENNPAFQKLKLSWDEAREILNKKPDYMVNFLIDKLQILADIKPYLQVIVKAEHNQSLTKDEIEETIIPYLNYAPAHLFVLKAFLYYLNQLDDTPAYIKTLPLDQKSKDELSPSLFITKKPV